MHKTAFEDAMETLEFLRKKILRFKNTSEVCEQVAMEFESLYAKVSIGFMSGLLQGAIFQVDIERLSDLSVVLKEFGRHGWHQSGDIDDYAEVQRRSYFLTKEGEKEKITLSGFFRGEACKFIKVGEEMRDKYELKCEPETI